MRFNRGELSGVSLPMTYLHVLVRLFYSITLILTGCYDANTVINSMWTWCRNVITVIMIM